MPDLNTIPATKSDDELAALKAADPAAFDLDEAPPQTDEERAAAESADKEAADAAAKAEAEKAEAAKDEAVDRRKFDGVLGDLRDTRATLAQERARAEALAAEVAALKAGPAVDYGDEIKKLDAAWNSDDEDAFNGTHAEYLEQRDALLVQKAEADALVKFEQAQAKRSAEEQLAAWDKTANAFVAANDRYKDPEELARFNEALELQFARNPQGAHADWLAAADKHVQALAIVEGRAQPEAKTEPKGPHDDRNKADAVASTKASAAPKTVAGGVSSAGGPIGTVDFANLKPGTFSKNLSRDQQAAALGSPDAL